MEKLKAIQVMPNFSLAGAEIMVENLTYELIKKGIDVKIISLYNQRSAITDRLESKNIEIYYLNKKKGLDFIQMLHLYKIFKREKPDVIHTHLYVMGYVIPAAIMAKIPKRIHTVHNIAKKENHFFHRKINKFFYKWCHVTAVSLSPQIKKTVLEEYKLKSNESPIIYNGVEINKYIPKTNYESHGIFTFLHIGRFSEAKNHIGLINSFKVVNDLKPDTNLILIGQGSLLEEMKKKVLELGLRNKVIFLGPQDTVYKHLHETDVFILPSRYEGMPMTLIEAMATGLPIITTNVGGIPDIINNNDNGLVVDVNEAEISKAMLKLQNSEQLRRKIGENALNNSGDFSASIMAEKYITIYTNDK